MLSRSVLPAIITAARAGALGYAQELFDAEGLGAVTADPAALAVKGRLLKDRAALLPRADRAPAYAAAAGAYAAADALAPQPYTRINVATLALLAGDRERATSTAQGITEWLASGEPIADTPYYLAATRAEALAILGQTGAAQAAMRGAIALAPHAYEDHAVTLHQLELIGRASGIDTGWIADLRPPRTLHFAGHMGVAPDDRTLIAAIDAILERERIGFGFGALAAGADMVIAERLLARGGELHVVLPLSTAAFRAQSVTPYGADWDTRFAAVRDAAASWTETAADTGDYEPLASRLAADVAMGAAVRHARRMTSEAVQLVIADDGPGAFGTGAQTARDAARWRSAGARGHVLRAPRTAGVTASAMVAMPEGHADRRLAAMLQIDFHGLAELDEAQFAEAVATVLTPLRTALAGIAERPAIVLPCGNSRLVAFATPEAAYDFARELLDLPPSRFPVRIAGHYGLAHWLSDPAALVGRSVQQLGALAAAALPGTLTVSEPFASALFLARADAVYAEPVGEIDDLRLYAIRQAQPC